MDCSLTGSSVHGIFQARILEWMAIPFSRESSQPRDRTQVSLIAGGFFHLSHQGNLAAAKSPQLCPTLCDPIDDSPPGSPIPGILQARTLESGLPFPSPMHESESEVAQSCPTLSDPMDCSPPGSSVYGIFQARVLEWGAIAFSKGNLGPPIFSETESDLLMKSYRKVLCCLSNQKTS